MKGVFFDEFRQYPGLVVHFSPGYAYGNIQRGSDEENCYWWMTFIVIVVLSP